jgi:hypothetical protein
LDIGLCQSSDTLIPHKSRRLLKLLALEGALALADDDRVEARPGSEIASSRRAGCGRSGQATLRETPSSKNSATIRPWPVTRSLA